jgi:hypothetical protein
MTMGISPEQWEQERLSEERSEFLQQSESDATIREEGRRLLAVLSG